jgi:hypothetical protein
VLIGGELQLQTHPFPGVLQGRPLTERVQIVHLVRQQQTQPGNVLRRSIGLDLLDLLSQLGAFHGESLG